MTRMTHLALALVLAGTGCGLHDGSAGHEEVITESATHGTNDLDPENPNLMVRPFSAEQIREEWVEGLELRVRRVTPEGETIERWKVVEADTDGATIEKTTVDTEGRIIGETRAQHSAWTELRDHASFPAAGSSRRRTVENTPLGKLEGWLYTIPDETAGTVSEFFFASSLPGAPVRLRVFENGRTVYLLEQLERIRPDD